MGRYSIDQITKESFEERAKECTSINGIVLQYVKNKCVKQSSEEIRGLESLLYLKLLSLYKHDRKHIIQLKDSVVTAGTILSRLKIAVNTRYGN